MRTTSKDTKMKSPQDGCSSGVPPSVPQSQPLQARSSNSGTSIKRSDISQSSAIDASSDKAFFWSKNMSSGQVPTPGQLTTVFSQKRESAHTATTATLKDLPANGASMKRTSRERRQTQDSSNAAATPQSMQHGASQSTGVSTRGQVRSTRASAPGQRAVKDAGAKEQLKQWEASDGNRDSLKPVKQAVSDGGNMRTTRSRSKGKQKDVKMQEMGRQPQCLDLSMISNGQSESMTGGNLEKVANFSINLKPSKKLDLDTSQVLQGEESKQQTPRSWQSTLNVLGTEKVGNQSFQINDSTDSLLENPLTTVIKEFQNLRTSAQLTGKNKPTIQQFLEKFEKEMQYLEDQYQVQQQARKNQMLEFEHAYGNGASKDLTGKPSKPLVGTTSLTANDQPGSVCYGASSQFGGDALMAQDTSTIGPMPHDNSNHSFVSGIHGPNQTGGSHFGGMSEVTSSEVYESFSFTSNSMMSFYPREVRRILGRRKINNSANMLVTDLRQMKPPKQFAKTQKTISKMQNLGLCQMNMMQILLQKISRKSKVIRKQEKIVNDNLKRKRIYLERQNFDLKTVLVKSQEVEINSTTSQQAKQKTRTSGSELTSLCPSTNGKSGEPFLTTSLKGSSAQQLGEETLFDYQTRKETRMLSGQENCLSLAESGSQQIIGAPKPSSKDNRTVQTPDPQSLKGISKEDQLQRVEAKVKQAVNLSEIDDTFLNLPSAPQGDELGSSAAMAGQQTMGVFHSQLSSEFNGITTPKKQTMAGNQAVNSINHISETPMFDYAQHKMNLDTQYVPSEAELDSSRPKVSQPTRKTVSTQARRTKRKSTVIAMDQAPPALNFDAADEGESSFAIAPVGQNSNIQALIQPDGKISLTIKTSEAKSKETEQAGVLRMQRQSSSKAKKRRIQKSQTEVLHQSASDVVQQEIKPENQRKLSPLHEQAQALVQQQSSENATHGQSHHHVNFMHSHSMPPMQQYVPSQLEVPFYDQSIFNGMQHDEFLMVPHRQPGIFNEMMKQGHHVGDEAHHQQAIVSQGHPGAGQQEDLVIGNRQQLLPQSNFFVSSAGNVLLDPMAQENLAGTSMECFDEHMQQSRVGRVAGHRQGNLIGDPFNEESAVELSSIEHTAFNERQTNQNQSNLQADAFGYHTGANPYELAKRRYMMESQKKLQSHSQAEMANPHTVSSDDRVKVDSQQMGGYEMNFVSPMELQHLSEAHQTPQNKMMGGEEPQRVTPSQFMSGVEAAASNLGRGSITQHSLGLNHQRMRQQQRPQQLSVSRLCPDQSAFSNPFNMSAHQDSAQAAQIVHQGDIRGGNFVNTPAGLLSGRQQMADSHRQHLSVSGWNIDEADHDQASHNSMGPVREEPEVVIEAEELFPEFM